MGRIAEVLAATPPGRYSIQGQSALTSALNAEVPNVKDAVFRHGVDISRHLPPQLPSVRLLSQGWV